MLASYWLLSCYTAVEVVFDFSDALLGAVPNCQPRQRAAAPERGAGLRVPEAQWRQHGLSAQVPSDCSSSMDSTHLPRSGPTPRNGCTIFSSLEVKRMEDVKNIYMTNDLNLRWMNGVRKFLVSSAELGKDIFPGEIKKAFRIRCPRNCIASSKSVWGHEVYYWESSICKAAIHQNVISNEGGSLLNFH